MVVGAGSMFILFAIFAGIGLYEASLHRGTGPTAVSLEVRVQGETMSPSTWSVREGDQLVLSLESDQSQTISIAGYGLTFTLTPAGRVSATFVATKAGDYDIILDRTGGKIGLLKVAG